MRRTALLVSTLASILTAVLIFGACAPNDERVRGGSSGGEDGSDMNSAQKNQVKEYSRSMLIELADVAHRTEVILQTVATSTETPPPQQVGAPTTEPGGPAAPAAIRTVACKTVKVIPSPANTIEIQTEIKGCKETGATFTGTQFGREYSFAAIAKNPGASDVVSSIRISAIGLETILKPIKNPRDELRLNSSRFLKADFLSEEAGIRRYRFSFESRSDYDLNLKTWTDKGGIVSKVQGVFEFDLATKKLKTFRATEAGDRLELKVLSARQGKNGGKITRQEFFGSGVTQELTLDLEACALPIGAMKSRFTVQPLGGKKYDIDSTLEIESRADSIIDKAQVETAAKLCSAEGQITMTEYYQGLIY